MERLKQWYSQHPRLLSWVVLALGMVVLLLYAAREVALTPSQLLVLVVATVLVAGACVWIIYWE
jgi:MFS superfamily sulfate permease-like transporter